MSPEWRNWAGTQRWRPSEWHRPGSVEEVRRLVLRARSSGFTLKVVGSGHSPNDMAVGALHLVSLERMCGVEVDEAAGLAVCGAGATLRELNERLAESGLALSCLGSISEQQLGGAIATGTHGTGARRDIIAADAVEWMELVDGEGRVRRCSREEEPRLFAAALVHLGCLGVVTRVCVRAEPAFRLREVSEPRSLEEVLADVDAVAESAEHARFWWFPHTDLAVVTRQDRTDDPATREPGAAAAWLRERALGYHSLQAALLAARAVPALVPLVNRAYGAALFGRRAERVARSDRVFNFDCLFRQHVNEWSVPRDRCAEALRRLRRLIRDEGLRAHFPVEVRFVRGGEAAWLSPAYGRDSCYIGIIAYRPYGLDTAHRRYFAGYQRIMLSLGGRPHWAKSFDLGPARLRAMYPRWDDFCEMRRECDPAGVFENEYVRRVFGS